MSASSDHFPDQGGKAAILAALANTYKALGVHIGTLEVGAYCIRPCWGEAHERGLHRTCFGRARALEMAEGAVAFPPYGSG